MVTSRVVEAAATARESPGSCPSMPDHYQPREHLYIIRYKCFTCMTGAMADDPDGQLRVRVAWLYFMEGQTQSDIAAKLGITRLRANRLLGEARESGLVNIKVNSRLSGCVALERELVAEAGLKDAVIVPTPEDPEQIADALGRATADYLARQLGEKRVRGLGIGWGATLRETVRHLPSANYPELSVNSMMGGLTHGLEINTFEIASELARRVNAQCNYLAA